jgi:hypothetical protein
MARRPVDPDEIIFVALIALTLLIAGWLLSR